MHSDFVVDVMTSYSLIGRNELFGGKLSCLLQGGIKRQECHKCCISMLTAIFLVVALYNHVRKEVSEEHTASIFRDERIEMDVLYLS
jgi:hypothetical protein